MALQKREKKLLKILGVIAVLSAIVLFLVMRPKETETVTSTQESQTPKTQESGTANRPSSGGGARSGGGGQASSGSARQASGISIDEFQRHNTSDDCWVLIDGNIYDITEYLSRLPNKEEASPYCGTFAFEEGFLQETSLEKELIINSATLRGEIG